MSEVVTWSEIYRRLDSAPPGKLYGIPRGGSIIAGLTGRAIDNIDEADWLIDDVRCTGKTANAWSNRFGKPVWAMFELAVEQAHDSQITMPWDLRTRPPDRVSRLERLGAELLEAIGYDPNSAELRDTPSRWARWWSEVLHGHQTARLDATFDVLESGRIVVISGLHLWSVCEHHLLPFCADASIAYVPAGRVLGLSKFARASLQLANRLQLQERLSSQIADAACKLTASPDVAVLLRGRHLCMEARGVKATSVATSLITRGAFERDASLRADFIALAASASDGFAGGWPRVPDSAY